MAGAVTRLARPSIWLVLAVLLAHALFVQWVTTELPRASILRAMAPAMFTRELKPAEPEAPPVPAVAKPRPPKLQPATLPASDVAETTRDQTTTVADSTPVQSSATQSTSVKPAPNSATDGSPLGAPGAAPAVIPVAPPPPPLTAEARAAEARTAAPKSAPPPEWPSDSRLNYNLSGQFRGALYGKARVQWRRDQERYEVRVEVDLRPLAFFSMVSQGVAASSGLVPDAYEEVSRGNRRFARMGERSIEFMDGKQAERPAGIQDSASQFVELAYRFRNGLTPLDVGQSVSYWMARPNGMDEWTYDVVGLDTLQTDLGPLQAYHLKPRPVTSPRGNVTAEMWFAPSLQYLPVRIKLVLSDVVWVDLLVEKIDQR